MAAGRLSLVSLLLALCTGLAEADEPLTLDRAVEVALTHHPALQADAAAEEARRAQVSVGRAGYLPSVDLSLQINGGSGNVLRGGLYYMRGIPAVSGPPTAQRPNKLAPGMYAEVFWPIRRESPSLFVPASAIVQTTEKTYVNRVRDGVVEQVAVQRGTALKNRVEVFGPLQAGDMVLRRGSEELKPGTKVSAKAYAPDGGAK